jgi:hypothetical protein
VSTASEVARIDVRKDAGSLLMLRSNVAPLFEKIRTFDARRVIVDFSGVEFMSRSFADEYLAAKHASRQRIEERGVTVEVRRMLDLVSDQVNSMPPRRSRNRRIYPPEKVVSL